MDDHADIWTALRAVRSGRVREEELRACLRDREADLAAGRQPRPLARILVDRGLLTSVEAASILVETEAPPPSPASPAPNPPPSADGAPANAAPGNPAASATEALPSDASTIAVAGPRTDAAAPTTDGGPGLPVPSGALTLAGDSPAVPSASPTRSLHASPPVSGEHLTFDRYRLDGELARGGMGVVYRAFDTQARRPVALKVMLADDAPGNDARERFRREALLAARLRHPNVVPVYDVGEHGGQLYYTMELIDGEGVDAVLRRMGAIPPRAALRIARDAARALHYAHEQGLVHRDIKPGNLLLTLADTDSRAAASEPDAALSLAGSRTAAFRVMVFDFGIARDLGAETRLTKTGDVLGTPLYMSPEQAEGETRHVGPASDVYSLGAVLYEMLSGATPFKETTPVQLLAAIILKDPPPLRTRAPRLSADLETLIAHAMEKNPRRRYASAQEFADDIDRYLAGEAIHARPPSWSWMAWHAVRRRKALAAAVTTLVATFLVLAGAFYLTPGTLLLRVSPEGARVSIDGREWTAGVAPLAVQLPAGVYDVRVALADHRAESREVSIERGRTKDFTLALAHDQGVLDAESEPAGGELEIDGVPHGSRVRNLTLDTGRHRIAARLSDAFDREVEIEVVRGEAVRSFLWLEGALLWRNPSQLSGTTCVVPDVDGDGSPELLCAEAHDLVLLRAVDGRTLWRAPAADSLYYTFRPADLGGDIGRVILVATERKAGLLVTCLDPRRAGEKAVVWRYNGPAQDWSHYASPQLLLLGDRNGDGILDLAVNGRDQAIHVLDGRGGAELARLALPVHALAYAPLGSEGPERLLFAGMPTRKDQPPSWTTPDAPALAGCLRLADGAIEWTAAVGAAKGVEFRDVDGDGATDLCVNSEASVSFLDGRTGRPLFSWSEPALFGPFGRSWLPHEVAGGPAVLVVGEGTLAARAGADAHEFWHASLPGIRGISSALVEPSLGGLLLVSTADALVAVEAKTGAIRWSTPGRFERLTALDADGDGRTELLATLPGAGLVCLGADGVRRWTLRSEGEVGAIATLDDLDGDGLPEIVVRGAQVGLGVIHPPRTLWERRAGAPLLATPVAGDLDGDGRTEVVSLGPWTEGRNLVCFDGATGRVRWGRTESATHNRGPGVADLDGDGRPDLVLVGGDAQGPKVLGFRAADGERIWECAHEGGDVYSAAVATDLNGDGVPDPAFQRWIKQDVVALDGRTRALLWRHPIGAYAMGAVGTGDLDGDGLPDVVAPFMDGFVYALHGRNGSLLWRAALEEGGSRCPPTLEDLTGDGTPDVLLMSRSGTLWVFDGRSGAPVAKVPGSTRVDPWGRPAVAHPKGGGTILLAPRGEGGVAALDWEGRKGLWQGPPGKVVLATPIVRDLDGDGRLEVVVGTYDGEVHVLDLATGRGLWRQKLGDATFEADPALADLDGDGLVDVVVADRAGVLTALRGRAIPAARRR